MFFLKKGVLKICSKFTWDFLNLLHNFRTPFPKSTSRGLLLSKAFSLLFALHVSKTKSLRDCLEFQFWVYFFTKILLLFQILIGNQNYKKHISCFSFDMVVLLFASCLFWRRIRHSWFILAKLSTNLFFSWLCYLSLEHWNLLFWPWFSE